MQNVYPWDPTSRVLCTVLNDPDLWGAVFSAELIGVNAHHMRQGFKRIAKRVLPNHPRVVYVKNDHSIGEVLTQLLERPQGRSELDRYLGEHTRNGATCSKWFGRHLYDYLEDRWFRHIPKLSLVKESGSGSYPRLDPVRFAAWLDEHDDSELNRGAGNEVARVLCLFACSFAMRQPETALDIRDTLSRRGDPYVRLLTDSVPDAPQEPAAEAAGDPLASGLDRVHPADEPTGRSVENEGMVASPLKPARQESIVPPSPNNTLGPTATVSNVANALTLLAGTAREVLLAGARDLALDQVTTLSRGLCEFLHDLDNERVRTAAQCDQISGGFAEVARQPWLHATPPELGAGWQAGANSIRELTERAAVVELQLARLQQACTQLDALVQRLGEQPGLAVPPGTTDRDQIAEQLEHRATEYRATLRRIGDREQDVADMVERLTMVDLKHGDPLIEVTPRASWLNLLLFLLGQRAYTEPGQRIERLLGRRDLAGLVLALSWHETSEKGLDLVGALIRELRDPSDRAQWSELLSYLGIDQVVRVAEAHPALLPAVAEMLLSVAVRSDPSVLSYFERLLQLPAMDTVCARVYAAVVESWWRGELNEPLEAIRARLVPEATDLRTDLRARLLQLVQQEPGMRGYYHKLRALARSRFFLPLRADIEQDSARAAWERWSAFGGVAVVVEECVAQLCRDEDFGHHDLETRYVQKLTEYVVSFREALLQWVDDDQAADDKHEEDRLRTALDELRRLGDHEHHPEAGNLRRLLSALIRSDGAVAAGAAPLDFGRRCGLDDQNRFVLRNAAATVEPLMLASWPQVVARAEVSVSSVLLDRLRQAVGIGPMSIPEAIQSYLDRGLYAAAEQAAGDHSEWRQMVAAAFEVRREAFLNQNKELLEEAQNTADPDIQKYLVELRAQLEARALDEAGAWLELIRSQLYLYRRRKDPKREALVVLLHEAGIELPDDVASEDLAARFDQVRHEAELRRLHVGFLQVAANKTSMPMFLREHCTTLVQKLDRPGSWPTPEVAMEIGSTLETILNIFEQKWQYRDLAPIVLQVMGQRLGPWLCEHLIQGQAQVVDLDTPAGRQLRELADLMKNHAPDTRLLQQLGVEEVSLAAPLPGVAPSEPAGPQWPPARVGTRTDHAIHSGRLTEIEINREIGELLASWASRETEVDQAAVDEDQLRRAARRPDWDLARRLAATLMRRDGGPLGADERLTLPALVYAVAAAHQPPDSTEAARAKLGGAACLAAVQCPPSSYQLYLYEEFVEQLPARVLIDLAGLTFDTGQATAELLAKALEILAAYPPGNPATRQLSELLWKASLLVDPDGAPCGGRLALLLWEALKKLPSSNAMPRSYLLQLLHNARQLGVLRHLASTARPWDVTIAHCLNVFEKAESDAGLNPQVHQVVAAFRENVRSKANCKPWQLLFDRLAAAAVHGPEVGLRVAIRLEAQSAGPDGGLDLELLVCPTSIVDPPARLELVVGDESNSVHQLLLSDDYILYKEQLVSVHVPPRLLTAPGESMILPFLITGHTLSNQPIREMGRWELSNAQETFTPMTGQEIREAWPGIKGDPVTFQRGFYGRESDVQKLVAQLTTDERPGSIMLFGERRIGKTSLLWRFIELYPPQPGSVCCAFSDVSNIYYRDEDSLARALFNKILGDLESHSSNAPIRKALTNVAGHRVPFDQLPRGVDPAVSIAGALEKLTEELEAHSHGIIGRIILCIDEFDRFLEPMLQGRHTEVEKLLWDLRQVVQGSRRVGVILAGSGLQRVFLEGLDKALYGSIETHNVLPFDWEREREASQATFLPFRLRSRLCLPGKFVEVSRRAHDLCGGHPYYLAILGYAAAIDHCGRWLTRMALDRIIDRINQGAFLPGESFLDTLPKTVQSDVFYFPVFQTLTRLLPPRPRALVKIILAHIAQSTLSSLPKLSRRAAVEAPDAVNLTTEDERGEALGILEKDGVIQTDRDRTQVWIRIPVTAAAIREHAIPIRQEAVRELMVARRAST